MNREDLSHLSMTDLFRREAESQIAILTAHLLELEKNPSAEDSMEALMRAAHSLKGAARVVGFQSIVEVSHALEDCFVAAQRGQLRLSQQTTDSLLKGVDLLSHLSAPDTANGEPESSDPSSQRVAAFVQSMNALIESPDPSDPSDPSDSPESRVSRENAHAAKPVRTKGNRSETNREVRVDSKTFNLLLGLAGESLVESRGLGSMVEHLRRFKHRQRLLQQSLEALRYSAMHDPGRHAIGMDDLETVARHHGECHEEFSALLARIEDYAHRSADVAHRLYDKVLDSRMRPLSEGIKGFPRLVRDLARDQGKKIHLEIHGQDTSVDRDILERIEAPLNHLLRNAVDHGIESVDDRTRAGKPLPATIRLTARHAAGTLQIEVGDDGSGIDLEQIRRRVVSQALTSESMAENLSDDELLEFIFLPGFSLKDTVTEISGRGVGLDTVQTLVREVHGSVRVFSKRGEGTRFQLQLPLTLSVVRSLLVEIGGEPYAIPLHRIAQTHRIARSSVRSLAAREQVEINGRLVGLISAARALGLVSPGPMPEDVAVVELENRQNHLGLIVERLLGERELVIQKLPERLGKVNNIESGAVTPDGNPVLVLDVDDLIRSIAKLHFGTSKRSEVGTEPGEDRIAKRILVVDDSLTVRELERKLLVTHGYEVDVANDGNEAWTSARRNPYDLIISDVDMPRVDGIELLRLVRADQRLSRLPFMIVSYKDREEDRRRGLEAGADYYLTKGSFHDDTLVEAVADLIGKTG